MRPQTRWDYTICVYVLRFPHSPLIPYKEAIATSRRRMAHRPQMPAKLFFLKNIFRDKEDVSIYNTIQVLLWHPQ